MNLRLSQKTRPSSDLDLSQDMHHDHGSLSDCDWMISWRNVCWRFRLDVLISTCTGDCDRVIYNDDYHKQF